MTETSPFESMIQAVLDCTRKDRTTYNVLTEECRAFQSSLDNVLTIFEKANAQFKKEKIPGDLPLLQRPISLVENAIANVNGILTICSSSRKLEASIFSKVYLDKLDQAKDDISEAIRCIVPADMAEYRDEGTVQDKFQLLVREELQKGKENLYDRILQLLSRENIVADKQDFEDQLVDLQGLPGLPLLWEIGRFERTIGNQASGIFSERFLQSLSSRRSAATRTPNRVPEPRHVYSNGLQCTPAEGKADEQYRLGCAYYTGDAGGVRQNYVAALVYLQLSSNQQNADASYKLGELYHHYGDAGLQIDVAKAVEYYQRAAEQNSANALYDLGVMYNNGEYGLPKDATKAIEYYQRAAEQNHASALYMLGNMFFSNGDIGLPTDFAKAVEYYQRASDQNHAGALCMLGDVYCNGAAGLPTDLAKMVEYYQRAADQNHGDALFKLGNAYYFGRGMQKDVAKAIKYYHLAADQKHTSALYKLGNNYRYGYCGLPKSAAKAVDYLRRASDESHAAASYELGNMIISGYPFLENDDRSEAAKYYQRAADQKHAGALCKLGMLYENGDTQKDVAKAAVYYQRASYQRHADASYDLALLNYINGRPLVFHENGGRIYHTEDDSLCTANPSKDVVMNGDVVMKKDITKAFECHQRTSTQKQLYMLGKLYFSGDVGLPKDVTKAVQYYQLASDQGHADASYDLGLMYYYGDVGLQKDVAKATKYYQAAAAQGGGIHKLLEHSENVTRTPRPGKKGIRKLLEHSENGTRTPPGKKDEINLTTSKLPRMLFQSSGVRCIADELDEKRRSTDQHHASVNEARSVNTTRMQRLLSSSNHHPRRSSLTTSKLLPRMLFQSSRGLLFVDGELDETEKEHRPEHHASVSEAGSINTTRVSRLLSSSSTTTHPRRSSSQESFCSGKHVNTIHSHDVDRR